MAYEREAQTDLAELQRLAAGRVETDPPSGYERESQTDVVELGRLARDLAESDPGLGGYERSGQTNIAVLRRKLLGGVVVPPVATALTLSGPSGGNVGVASSPFTVALSPVGGTVVGTVTITPNDGGSGGTFTPTTVGLTTVAPSATFTYTPASAGAKTISATNSGGLTNPTPLTYTAVSAGLNDGDPVSSWTDSSGNGHTATQTGSARPTFKTNILNGKPVVRFASASNNGFNLLTPVSSAGDWTAFIVCKPLTPTSTMVGLCSDNTSSPISYLNGVDGMSTFSINRSFYIQASAANDAFHVITADWLTGVNTLLYKDGTNITINSVALVSSTDFKTIGFTVDGAYKSDGDIAEIIIYQGALALRAKLTLLLAVLITTGELPSQPELDAMVGDRQKIKHYLHQHHLHATNAQLDAVVTPMAAGDRANIEKGLGVKYGITVAGGTAVSPDTVAGLLGWWKADSLG